MRFVKTGCKFDINEVFGHEYFGSLPAINLLQVHQLELPGHDWHTFDVAPNVVEYLPDTHAEHCAYPIVVLYFPATHTVHVPVRHGIALLHRQSDNVPREMLNLNSPENNK